MKPHSFCETPDEQCTMNYCDENGCINRNRNFVEQQKLENVSTDTAKGIWAEHVKTKSHSLISEFIPYPQALELKELGFNEPCFGYWNIDPYLPKPTFNLVKPFDHEWCVPAPTYSQSLRFFREKYKMAIINPDWNNKFKYKIFNLHLLNQGVLVEKSGFNTYEEAELAAIVKLIEIVKNK